MVLGPALKSRLAGGTAGENRPRWGALLGLVLAACGSSAPPPATHEHFRAIQRHEATLDRARTPALEGECADACEATVEGCTASRRICSIADSTSDVDARIRCRDARERCVQYESATARCTCRGE